MKATPLKSSTTCLFVFSVWYVQEQHSLTVNSTPDTAYTADTAVTAMQDTVRHRGDCTAVVTLCASKDIKDAHAAAQHCASDTTPQTDQQGSQLSLDLSVVLKNG